MPIRGLDGLIAGGDLRGRRVLVRADLNVPMADGRIADDSRIRAVLPTLQRLLAAGARLVVASHLGRPKGRRDPRFSLRPVAARLAELLGRGVSFCDAGVGPAAGAAASELGDGQLLLLENLRFHPGEAQNDPAFAAQLAELADVYVNDAFGTAHRSHASTVGVAARLAVVAAGDLLRVELDRLRGVLEPERPLLCLLGGAKVSDKLAVLEALAVHADVLAIGGAMAYTFLAARGEPTGASRTEPECIAAAHRVIEAAGGAGTGLLLPGDHVVAERFAADASARVVQTIPDGWLGLDIGPETAAIYARAAGDARTIFWNGPMGVFEMKSFAKGTETVARAVADSDAFSVVGGGDSLAAVHGLQLGDRISHLSTGGGASLEFVQGRVLPGVAALDR